MLTEKPVLIDSITAAADLDNKHRFVGLDGDVCGAAAAAIGVLNETTKSGQQAPVVVLGIAITEAGAAVTAGDAVESDASGRAITLAAGVQNGRALDAAAQAGDLIRVIVHGA